MQTDGVRYSNALQFHQLELDSVKPEAKTSISQQINTLHTSIMSELGQNIEVIESSAIFGALSIGLMVLIDKFSIKIRESNVKTIEQAENIVLEEIDVKEKMMSPSENPSINAMTAKFFKLLRQEAPTLAKIGMAAEKTPANIVELL